MDHHVQENEFPSDYESGDEPYSPRESDSDSDIESNYDYSSSENEFDDPAVGVEGPLDPNSHNVNLHEFNYVDQWTDARPPLHAFDGRPVGPTANYSELTPRELFELFVDQTLATHVIECTNAKAYFHILKISIKEGKPFHMVKINGARWYDMTTDEFYTYIALCFKMGITKEPKVQDYWSRHPMFGLHPVFPAAMPRSRFNNITKFIRYSRQTSPTQTFSHQERIELVLSLLNDRCQEHLNPGEHISIDEALVLFKGRLCFRQFIKLKRSRFGIKIFFLCPGDPSWQGYSWRFSVYFGRNSDFEVDEVLVSRREAADVGKSGRVVLHLLGELLGSGRHVVVDNWYTSQVLGQVLLARDTMITGTIKACRGIPREMRDENLAQNNSVFMRRGEELVIKFQDRSTVHCYTTRYDASVMDDPTYRRGIVRQLHRKKPVAIHHYNSLMGGVDKCDQYLQPYLANRKSLAWFKKLILHFLQRMVLNAYILWKNTDANKNRHTEFLPFKKQVIEQLLMKYSPGVNQLMTLHYQDYPPRPQGQSNRESRRQRLLREARENANRPRRRAPRDRQQEAPRDRQQDLDSDSDDDNNYPAPDNERIRITLPPASSASLVVPDPADLAAAGSSRHQPDVPSASTPSDLTAARSSHQSHVASVADDIGFMPGPPIAVPVSPNSTESTGVPDDSPRQLTELQPHGRTASPQRSPSPQRVPGPAPSGPPLFHQRVKLPPTERQQHPQKRCKVHYDKYKTKEEARARNWKKDKKTPYYCPLCPGRPGLCSTQCYDEYHKAKGFATCLVVERPPKRISLRSPTASPPPSESPVANRTRSRGGLSRPRSLGRGRSVSRGRFRHTSQSEDVDDPSSVPAPQSRPSPGPSPVPSPIPSPVSSPVRSPLSSPVPSTTSVSPQPPIASVQSPQSLTAAATIL